MIDTIAIRSDGDAGQFGYRASSARETFSRSGMEPGLIQFKPQLSLGTSIPQAALTFDLLPSRLPPLAIQRKRRPLFSHEKTARGIDVVM